MNAWWYGLILLVVDVAFAVFCGLWAQSKGYSVFWFTILGFLFNIVTAIVIVSAPEQVPEGDLVIGLLYRSLREQGQKASHITGRREHHMTWQGNRFDGSIGLTVEESTPAWPEWPRPEEGQPNVLMIVLDDVGYAHLGCYGAPIDTPHMDALAARGLRYANFHTTAMCSPTRSCLMTGRNHHENGLGNISELAQGFPGYDCVIPRSNGFLSEILQEKGYATMAVGKWHLSSATSQSEAGPRSDWPLGRGFDRFYGFLGAETDQFTPDVVVDNHHVSVGQGDPEYHFLRDMTEQSVLMLRDLRSADPSKPFFLYWCSSAVHAPHQPLPGYAELYAGRFDEGWDVYRERALARQIELGVVPEGTVLSPRPDVVSAWADLSAEQRRLYARQMEVFAAYVTSVDDMIGELVGTLEELGELEDTLVVLVSDNGASGEGQYEGSLNENIMFNGVETSLEQNLEHYDAWGTERTYAHYATGWCMAGNTPFPHWKRHTHRGGISDPMIVSWPKGIAARGEVRSQYAHAIDVMPTVLDVLGYENPEFLRGVPQEQLSGASFKESFADAAAAEHRAMQYYEMYGNRGLYRDGWMICSFHPTPGIPSDGAGDPGISPYDVPWELYDLKSDFSQSTDVAAREPERVRELSMLWFAMAGRYGLFPLHGEQLMGLAPRANRDLTELTLWPFASAVPNDSTVSLIQRAFNVLAPVELAPGDEGVIVAQGGRFAGWALFVQDGRLVYEQQLPRPRALPRRLRGAAAGRHGRARHGARAAGRVRDLADAELLRHEGQGRVRAPVRERRRGRLRGSTQARAVQLVALRRGHRRRLGQRERRIGPLYGALPLHGQARPGRDLGQRGALRGFREDRREGLARAVTTSGRARHPNLSRSLDD